MPHWPTPPAVFFDLDGTLADTAADLAAPVNAMRQERGWAPLPLAALRPWVSRGAAGLLGCGLGVTPTDPEFAALSTDFLARYERELVVHTRLFAGMAAVLDGLDARGLPWGVVSNKREGYVRPILEALGLQQRCVAIVGGDTTAQAKPHPEPLLHAASLAGLEPTGCVYVGDDLRDIQAGLAAGMHTVAAAYGYCEQPPAPEQWGAHAIIHHPDELHALLGLHAG